MFKKITVLKKSRVHKNNFSIKQLSGNIYHTTADSLMNDPT